MDYLLCDVEVIVVSFHQNKKIFSGRSWPRFYAAAAQQDVTVIGGGPGGYVAAIKAAQLGMKVRRSR